MTYKDYLFQYAIAYAKTGDSVNWEIIPSDSYDKVRSLLRVIENDFDFENDEINAGYLYYAMYMILNSRYHTLVKNRNTSQLREIIRTFIEDDKLVNSLFTFNFLTLMGLDNYYDFSAILAYFLKSYYSYLDYNVRLDAWLEGSLKGDKIQEEPSII